MKPHDITWFEEKKLQMTQHKLILCGFCSILSNLLIFVGLFRFMNRARVESTEEMDVSDDNVQTVSSIMNASNETTSNI